MSDLIRRRIVVASVGTLSLFAAACGGSHAATARVSTSSSTTRSASTTTLARARRAASAVTTTTVRAQVRATRAPARGPVPITVSAGGPVVPTVGPASVTPSSVIAVIAGTTPTTRGSVTTTTVKPFDPSQPIDLSGTPGVTPEQQAAAEQLLRDTLRDLPAFANPKVAEMAGYRSIGDGFTGDEHFVNLAYMNDGRVLDSKHPESLVYNTRTGTQILEAAMYMLPPGSRFTDIPPLYNSPLTQWHVHNDICFYVNPADPKQILVGGVIDASGNCPPGQYLAGNEPMLHAWIVKNPCGPFAALEGIGAGQVAPGESRNCDTGHAGVL